MVTLTGMYKINGKQRFLNIFIMLWFMAFLWMFQRLLSEERSRFTHKLQHEAQWKTWSGFKDFPWMSCQTSQMSRTERSRWRMLTRYRKSMTVSAGHRGPKMIGEKWLLFVNHFQYFDVKQNPRKLKCILLNLNWFVHFKKKKEVKYLKQLFKCESKVWTYLELDRSIR